MDGIIKEVKLGRLLDLVDLENTPAALKDEMFAMLLEGIKVIDGSSTLAEAQTIVRQGEGDYYCEMCRLNELDVLEARQKAWTHLPEWLEGLQINLEEAETIENQLAEGQRYQALYEDENWLHYPRKKISTYFELKKIKKQRLPLDMVFRFCLYYYVKNNLGKEENFADELTEFGKNYGVSKY